MLEEILREFLYNLKSGEVFSNKAINKKCAKNKIIKEIEMALKIRKNTQFRSENIFVCICICLFIFISCELVTYLKTEKR